ncbi:MAG: hypothetical protein WAX32_20770, partial [Raoultella planticola]
PQPPLPSGSSGSALPLKRLFLCVSPQFSIPQGQYLLLNKCAVLEQQVTPYTMPERAIAPEKLIFFYSN